jgi:putative redox protein
MASVHLESVQGLAQEIRTRGHVLAADEPKDNGGTDTGFAPYELLLAALAACTSATLRIYADRKGWTLGRIVVDARFRRDAEKNECIARTITFGAPLSVEQRKRLAEIAEKTPVTKTLLRGLPIKTAIIDPDIEKARLDGKLDEALDESFPASDSPAIS